MLARLRHRSVVGGDDEQHEVGAGQPAQRIANEPFVAWHIDEADRRLTRDGQVGETEVDRELATLFLRQPIGIDPGQRGNKQQFCRGRRGRPLR